MPLPLALEPLGEVQYYAPPPQFRLSSLFMHPMLLMMGVMALMSFCLPKMMDKEAMEEMQQLTAEKDDDGNPVAAPSVPEPPQLLYDATLLQQRLDADGKVNA